MNMTEEQLTEIIRRTDRVCPIGSTIQHRKTGGTYHVMALTLREVDLEPLVVYRSTGSRVSWSRPLGEVIDRFDFLSSPAGCLG